MKSNNLIHISQGVTLKYITPGSILIIAGIIAALNGMSLFAIPLLLSGVILLLSIQGAIIDIDNFRVKPYFNFIVVKSGNWVSLENYSKIVLSLFRENQVMRSRATTANVKTKTYDVYFIGAKNKRLNIKGFSNHEEGKRAMNQISEALNMPAEDRYQKMLDDLAKLREKVK